MSKFNILKQFRVNLSEKLLKYIFKTSIEESKIPISSKYFHNTFKNQLIILIISHKIITYFITRNIQKLNEIMGYLLLIKVVANSQ